MAWRITEVTISLLTIFLVVSARRTNKHRYMAGGAAEAQSPPSRLDDSPCQKPWPAEDTWSCGKALCQCTDTMADCSGHGEHLSRIPDLPSSITHLNFSHNRVPLIDASFFENATQITHLDLTDSFLAIYVMSFHLLPNLTYLSLAQNKLNYAEVIKLLSVTTLTHLDLSFLKEKPATRLLVTGIDSSVRLETLCLAGNGFWNLSLHEIAKLERLTTLDLSKNLISSFVFKANIAHFPMLTSMYLMDNSFNTFLPTCLNAGQTPAFPNLKQLFLHNSSVQSIHGHFNICLQKLQLLDLGDHSMKRLLPGTFNQSYFPSLEVLNIGSSPCKTSHIDDRAFNNPALQELYIRGNQLDFSSGLVHSDSFAGCPNLTVLNLSKNDFSLVTDDRFIRLFRPLTGLTELSLKHCFIDHLNARMFSSMNNLSQLSLDGNEITAIPDGVFDGMVTLTNLSLSNNKFSSVSEATFGSALRQRLTALDLSKNPFSCSCDLKWFQQWLTTDGQTSFSGPYDCVNMPNSTVRDFYVVDQSCLLSPQTSKLIIATTVLILVALIGGTTLYRHRWHLRLVLYEVCRGPEDRRRRLERLSQNFQYDLFVSYDSNDIDWVWGHLMVELEGRLGLKLCIHERDIPGKHIVENIADCVQNSKKVMMLFSINFAKSQWCQFELALCLSHVMEQGDALLVVMLHDIPSRDMTSAMMAVMKTTTYIEWGDEPEAKDSFWARIRIALQEILPNV